jgi:hypothetical protein
LPDFNVVPRERLADPPEAGVGDHLHLPLALGRFDFLMEKSVYAQRG